MHLNNKKIGVIGMNEFYEPPLKPDEIYHFGIKRRSGRYPWGSGERPYQSDEKGSRPKYEKKTVDKVKTAADRAVRSTISVALSTVGGVTIGMASGNLVAGLTTFTALRAASWFTPLGKKNVYFKENKKQ